MKVNITPVLNEHDRGNRNGNQGGYGGSDFDPKDEGEQGDGDQASAKPPADRTRVARKRTVTTGKTR